MKRSGDVEQNRNLQGPDEIKRGSRRFIMTCRGTFSIVNVESGTVLDQSGTDPSHVSSASSLSSLGLYHGV